MSDQPKRINGWLILATVVLVVIFAFFVPVKRLEGLTSVRTMTLWEVLTN